MNSEIFDIVNNTQVSYNFTGSFPDFVISCFRSMFDFIGMIGGWLMTPLFAGFTPLMLIMGAGFFVIIGLHIWHLVNPLG